MTYGSVCSGIEAATVAWHPLGWRPAWFAEIDPFCCALLKHHYPNVRNHGDFTRIGTDAGPVDLLAGGTPCQSFSVAGRRAGLDDPRGNLTLEFLALAGRLRPRWVVWENVPGVMSDDCGRTFGTVLGLLGQLGYGFAYRILDAQYFGVPQRRRRVFVVGCLGDWRRAAAVLFDRTCLSGYPAPRREAGERVAPCLESRATAGGAGWETDFLADGGMAEVSMCLNAHGGSGRIDGESETFIVKETTDGREAEGLSGLLPEGHRDGPVRGRRTMPSLQVAGTLGAGGKSAGSATSQDVDSGLVIPVAPPLTSNPYGDHESREGLLVAHTLTRRCAACEEDGTGRGTPLVPVTAPCLTRNYGKQPDSSDTSAGPMVIPVAFSCKDHGADAGDLAPTLRSMEYDASHANGGGQVAVAFQENLRHEVRETDVAGSLNIGGGKPGQGYPAARIGMAVRRLTPREAERLQGFPDDYTLILYRGKPAADGPRYRALGNSWAIPVVRWIGERIEQVEALEAERTA